MSEEPERDLAKEHEEITGVFLGDLASEAGMDTDHCEFCGHLLDDTKPWIRGIDGMGAHKTCIGRWDE